MHNQHWATNTLFRGLSEQQLQSIAPHVYEIGYSEHDNIMREGDSGDFMFMISEGYVEVFKDELKLSDIQSGEVAGLMSLIDTKPRSATVKAGNGGVKGLASIRKA